MGYIEYDLEATAEVERIRPRQAIAGRVERALLILEGGL